MDPRAYWVWLQSGLGPGNRLPLQILTDYPGGAEAFYRGGPEAWAALPNIRPWELDALSAFSLEKACFQLEQAEKNRWQVITFEDAAYPQRLIHIYNPPAVLYIQGSWPDFSQIPAVAIAGARHPLPSSKTAAVRIAGQLAASGLLLVGGVAPGVDKLAMTEAASRSNRVVGVLPVDLNSSYPMETLPLREQILSCGGALVTEHFHYPKAIKGAFHLRNRLITGLCFGIVLIQAGLRSGTFMYASLAAEQSRDVFVYPGPLGAKEFAGTRILFEEGAEVAWNASDVLRNLPIEFFTENMADTPQQEDFALDEGFPTT